MDVIYLVSLFGRLRIANRITVNGIIQYDRTTSRTVSCFDVEWEVEDEHRSVIVRGWYCYGSYQIYDFSPEQTVYI